MKEGARSAIWAVTYIVFLDWHFMFSRGFEQIALVDGWQVGIHTCNV
jgi:hypothetical protein